MCDSPARRLSRLPSTVMVLAIVTLGLTPPNRAAGQVAPNLSVTTMSGFAKAGDSKLAPKAEKALLDALNRFRRRRGCQSLVMNAFLRSAARSHSREMALGGFIGHGSPSAGPFEARLSGVLRPGTLVAENVAFASTVGEAESAFEASPGHTKNMLDPHFSYVGIGIATHPQGLFVTEDFAE